MFSIPDWLPSTIEPLCHAASIGKNSAAKISAQRALRDFKRTHYDQWEEHREKVSVLLRVALHQKNLKNSKISQKLEKISKIRKYLKNWKISQKMGKI